MVPVTAELSNSVSATSLPTSSSSLPQATTQSQTQPAFIQGPVVQVLSSINMHPVQTIPFPFPHASASPSVNASTANVANSSLRLLAANITSAHPSATLATSSKIPSHIFLISAPLDKTLAISEGASIWKFTMRDWDAQVEELVSRASYVEALALLDHVYGSSPSPKRTLILALNAVSQFRSGKYDNAINAFLDLDVNPAKVVALYPDKVAGRLAVKQDEWIALFGGPVAQSKEHSAGGVAEDAWSTKSSEGGTKDSAAGKDKLPVTISRSPSPTGSLRARTKTSFSALLPAAAASKEDDVASLNGKKKGKVAGTCCFAVVTSWWVIVLHFACSSAWTSSCPDDATRSLETLWRYLTSLRPKLAGALASHHITPSQSHLFPTLSSTSPASLYALPSGVALADLTEDELVKRAQIVDTALFKSYLIGRPSMLGPLCRLPNWCEVEEVEEELRAREVGFNLSFSSVSERGVECLALVLRRAGDMRLINTFWSTETRRTHILI